MSAIGNFMDLFFPEVGQQRRQRLLDQRNEQINTLLGRAPSAEAFVPETFPGEDPAMLSGQNTRNMATVRPGEGLLGGQMDPSEFYGRLLTIPGMEEVAGRGLLGIQSAQADLMKEQIKQQGGGPFGGTGMDAQTYNTLIAYNNKLRNNQPTTQEEDMAYALSYQRASMPQRYVTPDGQMIEYPGLDLSGYASPRGLPGSRSNVISTKPKSGPEASAISNAQSALKDLDEAKKVFFDESGNFNRGSAFASDAPLLGGIPGTSGRDARQGLRRSIEILLRARSGAAVPPEEVNNYMELYAPSPWDSDSAAKTKIQRLEDFFRQSLELMQAPGWKPEALDSIRTGSNSWSDGEYEYRRLPDGRVQRRKK